jgi:hypothetical protein
VSLPRKAIQAAIDRWWWGKDRAISAAAQVELMAECVKEFLAALPPWSLVADGKVVPIYAPDDDARLDLAQWVIDACEVAGISFAALAYVLAAAEDEVAE